MKNNFFKLVIALAIISSAAVGCSSTKQSTDDADSTSTGQSMGTGSMQDTITTPSDTSRRDTTRRDSM